MILSERLRTGYNPSDIHQLQSHTALERLTSGGLEPFLSHTKKSRLASYYMKMYNLRLKPIFFSTEMPKIIVYFISTESCL